MTRKCLGYARPGPAVTDLEEQREQLLKAGCDPILADEDGAKALASRFRGRALRLLDAGDVLTVTSFDRLGHSLVDIAAVIQRILKAGAHLRILDANIDTGRDPAARDVLLAMVEAQSRLVSARAREGLAGRRAAGKPVGPPVRLRPEQWPEVKAMIAARSSAAEMTAHFAVSRQTLWNFRQRMEAAEAAQASGSSENS